ncbi:DUF6188 family protein [Mycolicibacterium arenosum]|uniref:DUF6188 family protein n=1 Tax=Mycolicibacterium arenosum TaxID=2952157 RepID=A0ABT1M4F5_9MYCO|nr:DUF6188 family protein [Mycolicibacterium sp. CAU 1645]MCP9274036.1 DUF6188 family protein [Mycolicibacterium sp. CAU 1645]
MDLGLNGKRLRSVLIEYALRMEFSGAYFVVIESPFTVELRGETVALSPEDDSDERLSSVRDLVGQNVTESSATEGGALCVAFDGGARLRVEPDPAYEAWNVSGPDGALVVSTPGGRLAVWSAKSQEAD